MASLTTFTHQDPKDKETTKDDTNSDDDFSSGSEKTSNTAAKAKVANAKVAKAKVAAKVDKTKADSKKPNPLSAIRPSTSVKRGGVSVEDPPPLKKPRAVINVAPK